MAVLERTENKGPEKLCQVSRLSQLSNKLTEHTVPEWDPISLATHMLGLVGPGAVKVS